ncbi:hypothetical protein [Maribellus sediminis]|uniref:hypothetical protein n=1 Tax=Maribellus sediminis TaxID=2696285 RepID=UPI0014308542|nr:hypothetical protein [Maribellus sediminis]
MKNLKTFFLLSMLFLLYSSTVYSQDRIVLTSGDTITCTIIKVNKSYLVYSQNFNGVSAKGKVPRDKIAEWSYRMNPETNATSFMPEVKTEIAVEPEVEKEALPTYGSRLRVAVNGGLGFLLGDTKTAEESLVTQGVSSDNAKKYYKGLKTGIQGKASAYYHAFGEYSFGLVYKGFYTSSDVMTALQMDDLNMYYGKLGERYFVNFAGASFFGAERYGKNKQIGLNSSFSVGPAFYRDEVEMYNQEILVQGTTLGMDVSLGVEYFIKPNISLNFETSVFSGKVKKMTVTTSDSSQDMELDKDNWENLGRIDVAVGLVYYW